MKAQIYGHRKFNPRTMDFPTIVRISKAIAGAEGLTEFLPFAPYYDAYPDYSMSRDGALKVERYLESLIQSNEQRNPAEIRIIRIARTVLIYQRVYHWTK